MPSRSNSTARFVWEALKLPSVAFGIIALAVLWWASFALVELERTANRRSIENDTANLSRAFEQNVIRSLSEIDKTLLYLRQTYDGQTDWATLIRQAYTPSDITFQLAVIDARGKLVATDRGPQPPTPIDLSDREHFRIHIHSPADVLFISKPVLGRVSKKWSLQLTRRFDDSNGAFGGVLVASIDPDHFSSFFSTINIGDGGAITLVGLDGIVRASGGPAALAMNSRLEAAAITDALREHKEATLRYSDTQATNRIASLRWVHGYPLAVVVGTNENQPAAGWQRDQSFYHGVALALTLIILAALAIIVMRTNRLAQAQRELQLKSRQHAVTLENITQGMLMVDGEGHIGFMNSRLMDLLDIPSTFAQGQRTYRELVELLEAEGEFGEAIDADLLQFIRNHDAKDLIPHYERERPDGTVLEVRTTALADGGFVRTLTDITGRRRAEAKVLQLARHDALTGLTNRAMFRQQLEEASRHVESGRPFAVLMIDLDRFKPVNDTFGHAVGDLLLKLVAERLRATVRAGDIIGRLGGDEFAVIQMGAATQEQGIALADRICRNLCQPYSIDGNTILIGASVGVAFGPQHGSSGQDLLHAADLALYSVKAKSRGSSAVFQHEMHEQHRARRRLEEDLKRAIEGNQFELHYQPIVCIDTNEVTAYEALIRWTHPERGNVPPLDFIPLAEETGLIGPIGAWVMQKACNDISKRSGQARVAINLSPVQFRDRNLVDIVVSALNSSGLPPSRLEVEITESALLQDDALTQQHLSALKDLGVHITMDDFGTGYSSLSYLMSYPIQSLKIDRSFVQGLGESANLSAIVKTITTLASSLGLSTTAEGVETERQLALLRELGCTEAQGYYFSKPKPAAEILPPQMSNAHLAARRDLRIAG